MNYIKIALWLFIIPSVYAEECSFKKLIARYSITGEKATEFYEEYPEYYSEHNMPLSFPIITSPDIECLHKECSVEAYLDNKKLDSEKYNFNKSLKQWMPINMPPKIIPLDIDTPIGGIIIFKFSDKEKELCQLRINLHSED